MFGKIVIPPKMLVEMDNLRAENAQLKEQVNEQADALIELAELITGEEDG